MGIVEVSRKYLFKLTVQNSFSEPVHFDFSAHEFPWVLAEYRPGSLASGMLKTVFLQLDTEREGEFAGFIHIRLVAKERELARIRVPVYGRAVTTVPISLSSAQLVPTQAPPEYKWQTFTEFAERWRTQNNPDTERSDSDNSAGETEILSKSSTVRHFRIPPREPSVGSRWTQRGSEA
eukprot:218394_1